MHCIRGRPPVHRLHVVNPTISAVVFRGHKLLDQTNTICSLVTIVYMLKCIFAIVCVFYKVIFWSCYEGLSPYTVNTPSPTLTQRQVG